MRPSTAPSPAEGTRRYGIADVFPIMWAASHLAHIAIHEGSGPIDPTEVLVAVAGVVVLLGPRSVAGLAALAAAQLVDWWSQAPFTPDHWNLAAAINLILLLTLAARRGRHPVDASVPMMRVGLLVAYGAAAFAKWNTGFLDPALSCAPELGHGATYELTRGIPGSDWALIVLAVAAESLIFVGLLVPRTRRYAVRAGVVFHGGFSLSPALAVWDFTTMLFALFVLFLPADEVDAGVRRVLRSFEGSPVVGFITKYRLAVATALGLYCLTTGIDALAFLRLTDGPETAVWLLYVPYVAVVAAGVLPGVRSSDAGSLAPAAAPARASLVGLPIVALLLFTALNPYIGLRTAGAFTMFSNLHTEGPGGNHLVLPGWHVADYQNELFLVETSDDAQIAGLAEDGLAVTLSALRTEVRLEPELSIGGTLPDGRRVSNEEGDLGRVIGEPSWFERWLLGFRAVALDGLAPCGN